MIFESSIYDDKSSKIPHFCHWQTDFISCTKFELSKSLSCTKTTWTSVTHKISICL